MKKGKNFFKILIIGFFSGIISGLFSTGGGLVLVPAFLYLLDLDSIKSRATSIFCILPMVIASSFFYAKSNYLNWDLGLHSAIGGIIGSFFGTKFLNKIPDTLLKLSFTLFLLYVALYMLGVL